MENLKRKVPIKNVLYMFSYIWDRAESIDFKYLDNNDDFDSVNILAELFLVNINSVLKRGLYKEYKEIQEEIKGIKGKINFKDSLNNLSLKNAKAVCIFDELNENNIINQIIKTTAYKLYKSTDLLEKNKKKLNSILLYFNQVQLIEITDNLFDIKYSKNSYYTYYLIQICKLINECSILSEEIGKYKFINILDDDKKMHQIYELFVYKFYEREIKDYKVYYQKNVNWNLSNGNEDIIPKMSLDIVLENEKNTIIIDTKYYPEYMKQSFHTDANNKKLISPNMYQMFSYMNNYGSLNNLRGILLYPVPYSGEEISEIYDTEITTQGVTKKATLEIRTINLFNNWKKIKESLIKIIDNTY